MNCKKKLILTFNNLKLCKKSTQTKNWLNLKTNQKLNCNMCLTLLFMNLTKNNQSFQFKKFWKFSQKNSIKFKLNILMKILVILFKTFWKKR